MAAMVLAITACGADTADSRSGQQSEEVRIDSEVNPSEISGEADLAEEVLLEDLPGWVGERFYFSEFMIFSDAENSSFSFYIDFPSQAPTHGWFAAQEDGVLAFVDGTGSGSERISGYRVSNEPEGLEDVFETSRNSYAAILDQYRIDVSYYTTDAFTAETSEPMEINGLSTIKYTGTHSYTDRDGVEQNFPFAAYCIDLQQGRNSYVTVMVMEEPLTTAEGVPVPEGTIEAYARKMVESIEFKEQ